MADYVAKYTCGSCKEYTYEGKNSKGYCEHYGTYYYPDDHCDHWEEGNTTSSGSICYLTSACCEHKGLPDDCRELQALRRFRDTYLKSQDYGEELIRFYYADAPKIVDAINRSDSKDDIYDDIYKQILRMVKLIDDERCDQVVIEYMLMVYKLKNHAEAARP